MCVIDTFDNPLDKRTSHQVRQNAVVIFVLSISAFFSLVIAKSFLIDPDADGLDRSLLCRIYFVLHT